MIALAAYASNADIILKLQRLTPLKIIG